MLHRKIIIKRYESPCGPILLGAFGNKLCLCDWEEGKNREHVRKRLSRLLDADFEDGESEVIDDAVSQLEEYFKGERHEFSIPILLAGTDFQKRVWETLLLAPYGETKSYRDIASEIGRPEAVRAVAGAIGANAISLIVPCHRVIGSNNAMTGYAGGIAAKEYVLNLERGAEF